MGVIKAVSTVRKEMFEDYILKGTSTVKKSRKLRETSKNHPKWQPVREKANQENGLPQQPSKEGISRRRNDLLVIVS